MFNVYIMPTLLNKEILGAYYKARLRFIQIKQNVGPLKKLRASDSFCIFLKWPTVLLYFCVLLSLV